MPPPDDAVPGPPRAAPARGEADVYRSGRQPLDAIFAPKGRRGHRRFGAGRECWGGPRSGTWSRTPFGGTVYPVNPAPGNVLGIKAYPTIAAPCPRPVDLALIVTPAASVPDLVAECAARPGSAGRS